MIITDKTTQKTKQFKDLFIGDTFRIKNSTDDNVFVKCDRVINEDSIELKCCNLNKNTIHGISNHCEVIPVNVEVIIT